MSSPLSDELLRRVEEAANLAGEAAAEEVWATAIEAANNASRRLQSCVAIEAKIQSDQMTMHARPPATHPRHPLIPSPQQQFRQQQQQFQQQDASQPLYHHRISVSSQEPVENNYQHFQTNTQQLVPQYQTHPIYFQSFTTRPHHPYPMYLQQQQQQQQSRSQTFIQKISDRFKTASSELRMPPGITKSEF